MALDSTVGNNGEEDHDHTITTSFTTTTTTMQPNQETANKLNTYKTWCIFKSKQKLSSAKENFQS